MKKILFYTLALGVLFSCSDENLSDLNIDPKNPSAVPAETLYTNAQKSLFDLMVAHSVGANMMKLWAQHWTETTYNDEANYDIIGRDPSRGFWGTIYSGILNDLKSSREIIMEDSTLSEAEKNNRLAFITVLEVISYQTLVDLNGNVPYTEALDITNKTPVYDDAATIYNDLIVRLDNAIASMDDSATSFGTADFMYNGDIISWRKFANTIKLRMGMRLADVNPDTASRLVSEAVAAGVFESNLDNAVINYEAAPPNNNPLHGFFVLANRGSDIIAGQTIIDVMNALGDPRRQFFFDTNMNDPGTPQMEYVGGPIGANNAYDNFTHINSAIVEDPMFPGTLIDYAQVEFLLAEAAERSFVGVPADAEMHYNTAITASIEFWGGTEEDATNYLANPDVAYATAEGEWRQKIGTQKWIALFNKGFEAWTEYRRLDWPQLALSDQSQLEVPTRVFYPTTEPALNGANYDAAVSAMGGSDDLFTRIFWDQN